MRLGHCLLTFILVLPTAAPAVLPHVTQLAPGVYASGFAAEHGWANCGWVAARDSTLLIDLPKGIGLDESVPQIEKITGKQVRSVLFTDAQNASSAELAWLAHRGVKVIAVSEASLGLEVHAYGWGTAVYLRRQKVIFAGPAAVNGPRVPLPGRNTEEWIEILRKMQALGASHVVPGSGSWGGPEILERERRFLWEMRRQVGYQISMGRPLEVVETEVRIPSDYLVWMPYDDPRPEDIRHVYSELAAPAAPFNGHDPDPSDARPHALVLIGDRPHEPGHLQQGLEPVFDGTGVTPHFTVDVRALTAQNLAKVKLLVILRDGMLWPDRASKQGQVWMTPEQENAVVEFVRGGGGFLNLHNAMGLYPESGPYLKLVGGRYIGHGPLERFRVEVVDPSHPVTRNVNDFWTADEQHTPRYDKTKVHLLLENRSDAGKVAAAGWVYEPGRGRLCHLASGHTREALINPEFQRLMRNAVNWCLRREDATR